MNPPLSDFKPLSYDDIHLGLNIFSQLAEGKTLQSYEAELYPGIRFYFGPLTLMKQLQRPLTQSLNLMYCVQGGYACRLGSHEISVLKQGEFATASIPFVDAFEELTPNFSYGMMFLLDIPVAQTLLNEYLPEARFDLLAFSAELSRCRDVEGLQISQEVKGLLDDILQLLFEQDLASIKLKTLELMFALSKRHNYTPYRMGTFGTSTYTSAIECLELLISDPHTKKPVSQIVLESNSPEGSLKRAFMSITGMGIGGFLKDLRLRYGAKLLRTRLDLSIASIAQKTGYSNASKFSATFKDAFGYKPLQYRKMYLSVAQPFLPQD